MRRYYEYNVPAMVAFFKKDNRRGCWARAEEKFGIPAAALYQKMRYLKDIEKMKELLSKKG